MGVKRPLLTAPVLCLLLAGALSATPTRVLDQGAHLNRNSTLEVPGYEVALSVGFPLPLLGADPTAVQRPLTNLAAPSDTPWTTTTPSAGSK